MKRKDAVSLPLFERLGAEALARRFDGELFKHPAVAALSIDWQTVTCEAWCIDK